MPLFMLGEFTGHAGGTHQFKIECDALTDEDIETIAAVIGNALTFSRVHSIPTGGDRLAKALEKYSKADGADLIVDDVLTSGGSMEAKRREIGGHPIGVVLFARGKCPTWVRCVFQLASWAQ